MGNKHSLGQYDAGENQQVEDPAGFAKLMGLHAVNSPGLRSDTKALAAAWQVAHKAHRGQFRKSGEPYITHPVAVAVALAEWGLDSATLQAALLHDVVEDTATTLRDIEKQFGSEVAGLVDGVTKLDKIRYNQESRRQAETVRKMVLAIARDIRVLVLKLSDRLHNMRTLEYLEVAKRERIAQETLDIYAPLAHRLGIQAWKHELENMAFETLQPLRAKELQRLLTDRGRSREVTLGQIAEQLQNEFKAHGVVGDLKGRPKHLYSIYRKMVNQSTDFNDIHDLIGLRFVCEGIEDCYGALGLAHTLYTPVQGRFKDYIATPKANGYRSLHTTLIGPDGKPFELQIRTHEMHLMAEYGVASHWKYKEGATSDRTWETQMFNSLDADASPQDFLNDLTLDLYREEVFVLSPRGDVYTLPRGATPVDFAYMVHTEVGHTCVGATVNGKLVPLHQQLEAGDIVEITTTRSLAAGPSRDWLKFVKTARAKSKIRRRLEETHEAAQEQEGKEILREIMLKLDVSAGRQKGVITTLIRQLGLSDRTRLERMLGARRLKSHAVKSRIEHILHPQERGPTLPSGHSKGQKPIVLVDGFKAMETRMAGCCQPVPGEDIVGYVTVGRGVSVHQSTCTNLESMATNTGRMVDVSWAGANGERQKIWVEVEGLDREGLLSEVATVIAATKCNITASATQTNEDRTAILDFEIEVASLAHLAEVFDRVRGVDGVYSVFRKQVQREITHDPG